MIIAFIGTVLTYIANWTIYKKMGHNGWEGIIPIYNTYVLCKELYGDGWKMLLLLIPFYNIYFAIKMTIDLAHAFNQSTGFAIGLLFLPFIFNLILAFGDASYRDEKFVYEDDVVTQAVEKAKNTVKTSLEDGKLSSMRLRPWICEQCETENEADAKFCENCGAEKPKPKKCPTCGKMLDSRMIYCPSCGSKYDPDAIRKAKEAEAEAMGKKLCIHCGEMMPIDGKFCGKCGREQ